MALWVRTGGFWVSRRSPEILLAPPPVAAEVLGKMRKMSRTWIGAVCCSLEQRDADTRQQLSLAGEMEMDVEEYAGIRCDLCINSGWLVCDFCQGEKTNVKSRSSRFYRRCPNCKAVGLVLCPKCKVFKCVTFPDSSDGQALLPAWGKNGEQK